MLALDDGSAQTFNFIYFDLCLSHAEAIAYEIENGTFFRFYCSSAFFVLPKIDSNLLPMYTLMADATS